MNRNQQLSYELAQRGIECTPQEIDDLIDISEQLKELAQLSKKQLKLILDLSKRKDKVIYKYVLKMKKAA